METWGVKPEYALQPWRAIEGGVGITCFSIGWESDGRTKTMCTWMYDEPGVGRPKLTQFLEYAKRKDAHIVCWNAPFDIAWCLAYPENRELVYTNKWLDGALIYRRVINSLEKGLTTRLKAVVAQYLPKYAGYETDVTFDPKNEAERERLMQYNRLDALFTRELTAKFLRELSPAEQRNVRIESACLPMVAEANLRGLRIDRTNLADLDTHLVNTTETAYSELLAAEPEIGTVNLNSPGQVAELLFNKWGLTPVKQTETGNDSTDKETLHELSLAHPLARVLRTYREGINCRTKFSTAIATSLAYNGDGVVRPQARVFGTYTGRMTYSGAQRKGKSRSKNDYPTGLALHQMKRDPLFRKVIAPPSGYTLVEFDFAGQEYRWMAVMSGDETMLAMCQPGEDAHAFMAAQIGAMDYKDLRVKIAAGDKQAKDLRQLGKVGNLSCQYRTSAR
ncbi:MAG: DNA polymerase, partial [bacterium]